MSEKSTDKSLYVKLPAKTKLYYSGIEAGSQLCWTMITSFLMIYLTDSFLIPIEFVATMLLVCKLWDAVNDPIVGILTDRTRSKWGRYRPWIIFSAAPLYILAVLLFWPHPQWSLTIKMIYVYTLYLLLVLVFTFIDICNGSLVSVVSQDPHERGSMASWRNVAGFIAGSVAVIAVSLYEPSIDAWKPGLGYFIIFSAFAIIGIPQIILGAQKQQEIVPPSDRVKVPLKDLLKWSMKNKELIKVSVMFFLIGFAWYGILNIEYYWFIYVLKDGAFYALCCVISLIPTAFSGLFATRLANRFKDKSKSLAVCSALFSIINLLSFFIFSNSLNKLLIVISMGLGTFGACAAYCMLYGLVPDTVEYGELISSGIRMDGFINMVASFCSKIGISLGAAMCGWILGASGYVPNLETQMQSTITALNFLRWLMPSIAGFLLVAIALTYKIDYKKFDQIVGALQRKSDSEIIQ